MGDTPGSTTSASQANVQGSIRGRLSTWDRALIYGTAGVAFTGFNTTIVDTTGFFTGVPGTNATFSNTRAGWTAGGALNMRSLTSGPSTAIRISATPRTFRLSVSCPSRTACLPATSPDRKPGSSRLQLQVRYFCSGPSRRQILSQAFSLRERVTPPAAPFPARPTALPVVPPVSAILWSKRTLANPHSW